jgi:hypothetical protein
VGQVERSVSGHAPAIRQLAFVAGELVAEGEPIEVALYGAQINLEALMIEFAMQLDGGDDAGVAGQ